MNSNKENVIHRKQYQNANQIITVDVRSKPKVVTRPKVVHTAFKRNCLLRNEIDKIKKKDPKQKTTTANPQKATRSPQGNNNRNHKIKRKLKQKPEVSWIEFLASKNILPEDNVSYASLPTDRSDGGLSPAGSTSRRLIPIPQHLSRAMKQKDISLQCDMSTQVPTFPVRYLNTIPSRQKEHIDHLNYEKTRTYPNKPSIVKEIMQPQKQSLEDQTHTPFGESALHLIHQLREHLRSRGDSESTDLVHQLEAYIEGGAGSGKALDDGNEVFKFPSAPRCTSPEQNLDTIKKGYETTIDEQKLRIEQLEQDNKELRTLSAKLLEYHQKTAKYSSAQYRHGLDEIPVKLPKNSSLNTDSELESREALKLERDALLKKVQSQRDLIFNLEVKLHRPEAQVGRRPLDVDAPTSVSIRSTPSAVAGGFDVQRNPADRLGSSGTEVPPVLLPAPSKLASSRSDTDSAFDDRSVSQSLSKRGSPAIKRPPAATDEGQPLACRLFATDANEGLSLTRRSDYTDEEVSNALLHDGNCDRTKESVRSGLTVRAAGKVMESTRISSDQHVSPKTTWLSDDDLSGEEYPFLQAEFTAT